MAIFNQFSFVITALALALVLAAVLWRQGVRPRWLGLLAALYVGVAVLVLLLFRYPGSAVATAAEVERTLANGRPTFVMLYSNY